MTPKGFLEAVDEFMQAEGNKYKTLEEFYASVAREEGLSGVGADVASGLNPWPSLGLLEGGVSNMYMMDAILEATDEPFKIRSGLYAMQGEATRLPFNRNSLDVVLFHRCVGNIRGDPRLLHVVEDLAALEHERLSSKEADARAMELGGNVFHASIQETFDVLRPGGVFLAEVPTTRAYSELAEITSRAGLVDVRSKTARLGGFHALCVGRKPP